MRILVTGATGSVGRLLVDELLDRGATDVRALTVNPARAALPPGVEVCKGFVGDPDTLGPALAGVDLLYLAPHLATAASACRLAAAAGVRHIVDLAGSAGDAWHGIEDAVEASGVPHTHLEPGEFMANADIWAAQIAAGDVVRDFCGNAANAPIALRDIAAVAAVILLDGGHPGRTYDLTGPESLTRRQRVDQIGAALGRKLTYVELPRSEAITQLQSALGEYAEWYVDGIATLVDHPQAAVPTVAELTGRPGTTFAAWARENAGMFG